MIELDIRRYCYAYALEHLYRPMNFKIEQCTKFYMRLYSTSGFINDISSQQWQCYFIFGV